MGYVWYIFDTIHLGYVCIFNTTPIIKHQRRRQDRIKGGDRDRSSEHDCVIPCLYDLSCSLAPIIVSIFNLECFEILNAPSAPLIQQDQQ